MPSDGLQATILFLWKQQKGLNKRCTKRVIACVSVAGWRAVCLVGTYGGFVVWRPTFVGIINCSYFTSEIQADPVILFFIERGFAVVPATIYLPMQHCLALQRGARYALVSRDVPQHTHGNCTTHDKAVVFFKITIVYPNFADLALARVLSLLKFLIQPIQSKLTLG